MSSTDLQPLLAYLRDIGWGDVYSRLQSETVNRAGDQGTPHEFSASAKEQVPLRATESATEPSGETPAVGETVQDRTASEGFGDASLATLAHDAESCVACPLSEGRTRVVFGSGAKDADLMFIGEGPGYNEDQQGLPFVGRAGELLTRIIRAIDLDRQDVYIANIVKCRPPNNRDPKPEEVAACIGYLRRQIELVEPRVIVALGRVAAQTLLESSSPIGRMRGSWHEYRGVPLRVTYHPAALLRNNSLKRPTWEDMQVVRDFLLGQ